MTISIPASRTIDLEAKAGGGFRSVGLVGGSVPGAPVMGTAITTPTSIQGVVNDAMGATSYQVRIDGGVWVNGLTATGLTANTQYSVEWRGTNEFGTGPATTPVNVTTDEAAGGGLTDPSRLFTINRSFSGTVGVKTSLESDGLDDIDGNTKYSNEQAFSGTTSGKMTLLTTDEEGQTPGGGGYGRWGGLINFTEKLQEGDEVFFRWRMYFPSGFIHYRSDDATLIKHIRIRSENSGGSNQGYADIYWDTHPGRTSASTVYRYIKEGIHQWYPFGPVGQYAHTFDNWETFNMHFIISSDPNISKVRVWKESDLIANISAETLNVSSDLLTHFYLFTYWNGPVPQEQSCYVDDIIITSDRAQTSTHPATGFPWIGV